MGYEEAQYAIDEVLDGIKKNQITGLPPTNVTSFSLKPLDGKILVRCVCPEDTVIEGQTICTVKGVRILKKVGSAPISFEDGQIIYELKRGEIFEKEDTNVTNGLTYYYAFFPFSDHGVFNYNPKNIKSATPSRIRYWAFDQNFLDKDPETTITYPSGCYNDDFLPMMTNSGNGEVTAGSWSYFLKNILCNVPLLVNKASFVSNGFRNIPGLTPVDYIELNPTDYSKDIYGNDAPVKNTTANYEYGAFSQLISLPVHEEYSKDGNSREVVFASYEDSSMGVPDPNNLDGFFSKTSIYISDIDSGEMNRLEHCNTILLPMIYINTSSNVLFTGTTKGNQSQDNTIKYITDYWGITNSTPPTYFSARNHANMLGGPAISYIRDLLYMLFKTTNIQKAAGYGLSNNGSQSSTRVANNLGKYGPVPGFYGSSTGKEFNTIFHSLVLGSYSLYILDPHIYVGVDGGLYVNNHYQINGGYSSMTHVPDEIYHVNTLSNFYPSKMVKLNDIYGSIPAIENTGSDSTGLCDMGSAAENNDGGYGRWFRDSGQYKKSGISAFNLETKTTGWNITGQPMGLAKFPIAF